MTADGESGRDHYASQPAPCTQALESIATLIGLILRSIAKRCVSKADAKGETRATCAGTKRVTRTDSGPEIHKGQPQIVTDAIRDVADAVRRGCARVVEC